MKIITRHQRLLKRAYWLVDHRWLAIVGVAVITWLATNLTNIELNTKALYTLDICLIVENLLTLFFLEQIRNRQIKKLYIYVRLAIQFQIVCDLTILTFILHYTGGIENPFFLVYIFHMVISSILLSRTEAFIQSTLGLLLFGLLVFLEFKGVISHHCLCLEGLPYNELYLNKYYVGGVYIVFVFISYILVYLTTSIGHRLRNQEDKLTTAIEQLKKNDEIKNEYVLRITHDTKNHLAAIQTNLSVLTSGVFGFLDGKQKEFLERAFKRTEKLNKFSRNLLHLTKLRLSNKIEKEDIVISDIIANTLDEFKQQLDGKNIHVVFNFEGPIGIISGNKISIEEVFQNLIGNAIKYNVNEGLIEIFIINKPAKVRIEIGDTGVGIPGQELSSIFNEFYRATNVKGTSVKGSGIGLSLVREIVKRHNGKIWAENRPEKGSKFIIELPNAE